MPFTKGDDVFVIPTVDTGEVVDVVTINVEYNVDHDIDRSRANRLEGELKKLPFRDRYIENGFLWIVKAQGLGNRRKADVKACVVRKDGSLGRAERINPRRSPKPPPKGGSAMGTAAP